MNAAGSLLVTALLVVGTAVGAGAQDAPPPEQQVEAAVMALPAQMRDGATVLGHRPGRERLATLREGSGEMVCIADRPGDERWHVACYHESLEPFMARGRELRARGLSEAKVDSIRHAEAESGELSLPEQGGALYSLTGPAGSYDPATGEVSGDASPLFVLYMPWATPASTGLSPQPRAGAPWLMEPGTPTAHMMLMDRLPPGAGGSGG